MKLVFAVISMFFFMSCSSQGKKEIVGETDFQKKMNAKFKDASTSPLTKKGLKKFNGLDFFPVNAKYKVKAKLIKTPDGQTFNFPTTTDRIAVYRKYGEIHFTIDGKDLKLNLYKNQLPTFGYETHLFLPFLDKTNGSTSYGGGRFIDVLTTDELKDGTMEIDFNKAYNPYCAYSDRYSCPITPKENYLDIEVKAGVMAYKK